ncbi:MAG: hypothetical protein ACP5RP_00670 [Candidatus Micrarchaeia archaeon]
MHMLKFEEKSNTLKIKIDSIEDLWTLQRIIFENDEVEGESKRKFKSTENDKGELKDVRVSIRVEKTELDKNAGRLRVLGKIISGSPMEYIQLNAYHTLSIGIGDIVKITKTEWPDYIVNIVKTAISESKKPKLGILLIDDEKMLPAYVFSYGIKFENEIYSNLSKRLSPKDFEEALKKYYTKAVSALKNMNIDTCIVAGPGFTTENFKRYVEENHLLEGSSIKIVYAHVSNVEKTGVYELIYNKVANILEEKRISKEFELMEEFLRYLSVGKGFTGIKAVSDAIEGYMAKQILINDSIIGLDEAKELLKKAEIYKVNIEIINAEDEVGEQLQNFGNIVAF